MSIVAKIVQRLTLYLMNMMHLICGLEHNYQRTLLSIDFVCLGSMYFHEACLACSEAVKMCSSSC